MKLTICAHRGDPLYCLDARLCWRDYDVNDYNFSGALDCRLFPLADSSSYPTLLQNTKSATRDWQSFGRFTREELIGLVGRDSSRSLVQRCWVRGMSIEIEISNVVLDEKHDGGIDSLDMAFRVKNAPSVKREIAAHDIDNRATN